DQDQKATSDLEGSYKMRGKSGIWESDPREAENSHGRVDEFENSLREEDQAHRQPDEDDASYIPGRSAKSIHRNSSNGRACTYMADRPMSLRNPRRQMIALGYPRMLSNFDIEIR